jgi:hopanoid biosynthesis associated radical SAM protein HpnH
MSIPLVQQYAVARYVIGKKLRGVKRYPLTLMLEPLFQCNLACPGCGKIDYENDTLRRRMSVDDALHAVDECGAPMVSIAGGEPLIHKEIAAIAEGIMARGKFVYLCTNALLLKQKLDLFTPSPYLTFSVHLDGDRERHDQSVDRKGVFDTAVEAISLALKRGFRVTINCTLFAGEEPERVAEFFDYTTELGVEGITLSPGYSYQHAPRQDAFLPRARSKELFRGIFRLGKQRRRKWKFNQSSLFLDFLAGNQTYQCTPWSMPCYNMFGWQKPCYLLVDEGHVRSFEQLMNDTDWEHYGFGHNPKCDNCMAHCGYEGTAVDDTFAHPLKAFARFRRGPVTEGDMAPDLPILYGDRKKAVAGGSTVRAAVPVMHQH